MIQKLPCLWLIVLLKNHQQHIFTLSDLHYLSQWHLLYMGFFFAVEKRMVGTYEAFVVQRQGDVSWRF